MAKSCHPFPVTFPPDHNKKAAPDGTARLAQLQ